VIFLINFSILIVFFNCILNIDVYKKLRYISFALLNGMELSKIRLKNYLLTFGLRGKPQHRTNHRVHIFLEMKKGKCVCPLSWSVHCNFTSDCKCNERGWACRAPPPHQPGLILPSGRNVRQKAAVATLCTLWD
jgi:hypothetical protein